MSTLYSLVFMFIHLHIRSTIKATTSVRQTEATSWFYLVVVPLKELQEAGLGSCGALDPAEAQVVPSPLQVADVHGQVLQPKTRSFPHRGQLGGSDKRERGGGGHNQRTFFSVKLANRVSHSHSLVVCEAERREVGVLLGKVGQPVDDPGQLWGNRDKSRNHRYHHSATTPGAVHVGSWD